MKGRRVVVTGLGMVSPLGLSVAETWAAILEGKSGVAPITDFDPSELTTRFAAQVKSFEPTNYMKPKDVKRFDSFIHYGYAAALEAWKDANINLTEALKERSGVCIGSGIGGISEIERQKSVLDASGPKRVSPFFIPGTIINMVTGYTSIELGLEGPNLSIVTACTTGTHAIGMSARLIAAGDADVMVCGGAEKASSPLGIAGFASARALSTRNEQPELASRPWDKDRDGFVLGDGAGVVVLEEYEHAKARGAKIYAELVGFGMSGDAYHITLPSGKGAALAMQRALEDAGCAPSEVQYINAHGTSTQAGDTTETKAVKTVFGEHAAALAVSSTKSMIGHLLGAAGSVEAIFSILSIRDQVAPPTINLDTPDADNDLDYVPHHARNMRIEAALNNSFGFGGTNGSLLFRKL